jgi:predicted ribosomally synthesized peptide with SipW-like signal peptide
MSDKKFDLTRRKVLLGLGGIGAGAALGGAGTMAYLNDKETSRNNVVAAGKLNLKIDWWQRYYQGKKRGWDGSHSEPTDNPGPIFQIYDAKPGDWGCGLISLHNMYNPAYVWFGCELWEDENGIRDPEDKVDHDRYGELAENIKVALLRYPYIAGTNSLASEKTDYQASMADHGYPGDRDMNNVGGCDSVFVTTLKDLCKHKIHGGHLLDGMPGKKGKCFKESHTYFYGFCWWIPRDVGNEIQSDKVKFSLKFYAEQCRHNKNPENRHPFADDGDDNDNN